MTRWHEGTSEQYSRNLKVLVYRWLAHILEKILTLLVTCATILLVSSSSLPGQTATSTQQLKHFDHGPFHRRFANRTQRWLQCQTLNAPAYSLWALLA
jgi:hypothetical protein